MRRLVFWLALLGIALAACATNNTNSLPTDYASLAPPPGILDSPDAIAQGRVLFLQDCAACHGVRGDGRGKMRATFGPPPANFTDPVLRVQRTPQYLFWRISEGGRVEPFRAQGSIMPAWKYQLSEAERWQLVAFLRTLAP
ncbi:MAG: cytochrome c [Chloroflexi bacterium]|nr:cytochrome c [Chloroflexota bacterium]